MRKRRDVVGPVKQLGHTGFSADPVACGESMLHSLSNNISPDCSANVWFAATNSCSLELILDVTSQRVESYSEQGHEKIS